MTRRSWILNPLVLSIPGCSRRGSKGMQTRIHLFRCAAYESLVEPPLLRYVEQGNTPGIVEALNWTFLKHQEAHRGPTDWYLDDREEFEWLLEKVRNADDRTSRHEIAKVAGEVLCKVHCLPIGPKVFVDLTANGLLTYLVNASKWLQAGFGGVVGSWPKKTLRFGIGQVDEILDDQDVATFRSEMERIGPPRDLAMQIEFDQLLVLLQQLKTASDLSVNIVTL